MEEKEIIRGKRAFRKVLKIFTILLISLTIFSAISSKIAYNYALKIADEKRQNMLVGLAIPDLEVAHGFKVMAVNFLILFILVLVFNAYISKMEIVVTNFRVYGKKAFGKRVDLPLNAISAVGTGALRGVYIGTSAGKIYFRGIANNEEIHGEISKLLNEIQSTQITKNDEKQLNQIIKNDDEIDKIKRYKELLDIGAITQEEFDVKKKELLK